MGGTILLLLAALSLTLCLLSPMVHFMGLISFGTYKTSLNLASLAWFIFAGWWMLMRTSSARKHQSHEGSE